MNNKKEHSGQFWIYYALSFIIMTWSTQTVCANSNVPAVTPVHSSASLAELGANNTTDKVANVSTVPTNQIASTANTANTAPSTSTVNATPAKTAGDDTKSTDSDSANTEVATTAEESAAMDESLPPPVQEKDPYEGFNRAMFTFNDKLDTIILKPIATLYNKIMPKPLNMGIHNVFENINNIPTICDDILQANFYQAANDTWRLGINSTVGIGGLFDIAERMNLDPYSNDFGMTLARWGYTSSNYLVLPFFGPNTLRDGLIGLPVDYFAFSVYPYIQPPHTRYQIYALGVVDRRAQLLKLQGVLDEASFDKYVFARNAYMQRRVYQIEQNNHRSCCDRRMDNAGVATPPPATDENYD